MSAIAHKPSIFFSKENICYVISRTFITLICLLTLSSCTAPVSKTNSLSLIFTASSDLNPDVNGRASPLALTIYQLKNSSMFKKTDYVSLAENGKSLLAADLITINTVIINPGQTLKLDYSVTEGESAFGIIAGYRVVESSVWQLVYDYPSTKKSFFSNFSGSRIYSHKVILERNKMQFTSAPEEH